MSTVEEASTVIGWAPGFAVGDTVRVVTTDRGYGFHGEIGRVTTLYIDQPSTGYIEPQDITPDRIDPDESCWIIDVSFPGDTDEIENSERYLPSMLEHTKEKP